MPFCLVCQHLYELVPSQVSNGSVHRVFIPTLHVLNGQVFYAICVNLALVAHHACQLVQEIFSLSCYFRIQLRYLFLLALEVDMFYEDGNTKYYIEEAFLI